MQMTRKLLVGAAVATASLAWAVPMPAHAAMDPPYFEHTSEFGNAPRKVATVDCPAGRKVFGMGGRIVDGAGRVALVGLLPNADLTSVSAIGRARPGHDANWHVVASAVCVTPWDGDPLRMVEPGKNGTAAATCPGETRVFAGGFLLDDPTNASYVDAVVPGPFMSTVVVRAGGGTVPPNGLASVAICARPPQAILPVANRRARTVPVSAGPSTAGDVDVLSAGVFMFGAGAQANRDGMFIEGIGPAPDLFSARAIMARGPLAFGGSAAAQDGDEMAVYGTAIGSWYEYPS